MNMYKLKEEKGITLVALVITIIVLLCLAGVIVYLVFGQDGLQGKDNAVVAEMNKTYAKDVVTMALKVVEKDQEDTVIQPNTDPNVVPTTDPNAVQPIEQPVTEETDVIDEVVKAIDKASNFTRGADGKSVEYVTNDGDKYVVSIDTENLTVTDVN